MNTVLPAAARPPGPKSVQPFLGVLTPFKKDPPGFLLRNAREFGDLVFLPLARQRVYLVNRPEWIRDILVTHQANFVKSRMLERAKVLLGEGLLTSEGEFHTRQRRLVQPAFHRDRMAHYGAQMIACAARVGDQWQAGSTLDIAAEMPRLTLTIVGRTLFGADVSSDADEIGRAMTAVFSMFDRLLSPFSEWLEKLPLPSVRRFERARASLDGVIYRLIAERRASGRDAGDLLSMLLLAQDEDRGGMTDQQVRDEALTLLIAGHETTANALIWTWYLLSQNPQAEARMHAELEEVLRGRLPVFDDVTRLPYTAGVFSEALRLYPPAWGIGRRAKQDYQIGEYIIPAGSILHHESVGFPPRSALVSGAGEIRSRALAPGDRREAAEVRIFPLRRRRARMYRGALRLGGGPAGAHDPRAEVEASSCAGPESGYARGDYPQVPLCDAHDRRTEQPITQWPRVTMKPTKLGAPVRCRC